MKKSQLFLVVAICGFGLASGYFLKWISSQRSLAGNLSLATDAVRQSGSAGEDRGAGLSAAVAKQSSGKVLSASPRSTDTVASILALDPETNYARIALWTATASEQDLAAYWSGYKGGKRRVDVTDLIFLNWTRRNPQAAVAAVAGTEDDRYAWWSWSANDPQAALIAVKNVGKDMTAQVAAGIGDFHPDWLVAHLDLIPEEVRGDAFGRMRNWPGGQDPLKCLEVMKKNGVDFNENVFKSLALKDPWAALDWARVNPQQNAEAMDLLVSSMAENHPEDLEHLAAQTPAGEAKRKMEQALFVRLLESDPAAALIQARAIKAPSIAAKQLGQIGLSLVNTDPAKAFEIGKEMLAANPGLIGSTHQMEYENGSSRSFDWGEATQFLDSLIALDRPKAMDLLATQSVEKKQFHDSLPDYSRKWAGEDLVGFTNWTNQQTDPKVRTASSRTISSELAQQGQYLESIEWARSADPGDKDNLRTTLYYWQRNDPEAAEAWLENSDLSNEQKSSYRDQLKKMNR